MVFFSGHTSLQRFIINNKSKLRLALNASIQGGTYEGIGINPELVDNQIKFSSQYSAAIGYIKLLDEVDHVSLTNQYYYLGKHAIYRRLGRLCTPNDFECNWCCT